MSSYNYVRRTARLNGKKYEATGKTVREAERKLAEKLAAARRGEDARPRSITVDNWFQEWMDVYKIPSGIGPGRIRVMKSNYNSILSPVIGSMKLGQVQEIHLQNAINTMAGRSSDCIGQVVGMTKAMFQRAHRCRYIPFDPSVYLEAPTGTRTHRRSLTEEERAAALRVGETHKHGLWLQVLLYTGMRPGETAVLRWSDVDFAQNEIHVHAGRQSRTREIKSTKTPAGVRDIPIRAPLLPFLQAAAGDPDDLVFPDVKGQVRNDDSMYYLWTTLRRAMDIELGAEVNSHGAVVRSVISKDLCPYTFRHTFCTDLQKAGVPLNVAKELMGHSNISVTANIYTHRDAGLLHEYMGGMDGPGSPGGKSGGKPPSPP